MDELESTVQKYVTNFCNILPIHVEKWRKLLEEASMPNKALCNYAEQLRHVEKADIEYIENFTELQGKLKFKIFMEMEDEMKCLRNVIDRLNQANQVLKNKLSILEKSSNDLNWESDSSLLTGTALQPPLTKVLQEGLTFWRFFSNAMNSINENFKNVNVRDEKAMTTLEKCFQLDLEHEQLLSFLALTQYVNNNKAVI
nr:uncharacterized protein LOC111509900 [Leptinotarsa decemlineata]